MTDILAWVAEELVGLQLGDARLATRQARFVSALYQQCQASIPTACAGWDEIKGAYRFLAHPAVTQATVLAPHLAATQRRVQGVPWVVIPQDTTELDFSRTRVAGALGPLNVAERVGWFLHLSAAFTLDRVCLGVVGTEIWTRDPDDPHKNARHQRVPLSEKESQRWLTGYRLACTVAAAAPTTQVVSVADREGDIYEIYLDAAQETADRTADWVIRACQDRSLPEKVPGTAQTYQKLWARVAESPVLGDVTYELPAKGGRPARRVHLTVQAAAVTLRPPYRPEGKLAPVPIHAVLLRESAPPPGEAPIEWLLLTSLPVDTWDAVRLVIECYLCRWQIECFFKVLKSGCRVEKLQLETPDRVLACLSLYLIVAWRVLYLTMLGRTVPNLPCTVVFGDAEWKAVFSIERRGPPPETPPTLAAMVRAVARQGSYVGRAGDGHPGIVSIWTGLQRVMDYARAWEAFGPESETYG